MKSKKGTLLWDFIIIGILAIVVISVVGSLSGIWGKAAGEASKIGEQIGIATTILPQSWYDIKITDATQGELKFTVQNRNTTNYETDFDRTVSYKVLDNNAQTTVWSVKEYPVAYIAVVVDNATTGKFDDAFWSNLTKIKFSEANIAVIPVTSPIPETIRFNKTNDLDKPAISATSSADYWGALAKAGDSLPIVQAKQNLGLNFLAIISVSEGRCTVDCDNQTKISSALLPPPDTHFYMLRSDCSNIPANGNSLQQVSNATLEGYKSAPSVLKADCYTDAAKLFADLTEKDLAPITLTYEPKNPPSVVQKCPPDGTAKPRNVTVEVTKRTGVLGTGGAYSGKGSTLICYTP